MGEAFTSIEHLRYSQKNVSHPYDLVKFLIQQSLVFFFFFFKNACMSRFLSIITVSTLMKLNQINSQFIQKPQASKQTFIEQR